jgi:hypothetical protein
MCSSPTRCLANVSRLGGFGTITDQAGNNRQGLNRARQLKADVLAGSTTQTVTGTAFAMNHDDNMWNNPPGAKVGHNFTTITLPGSPRDLDNNLAGDRIWVTLEGWKMRAVGAI